MYIHTQAHSHMCIYIYTHTCVHTYMHTYNTHVHTYIFIPERTQVHHIYAHVQHTCTRILKHRYIYTHIHVQIHTHTYTHVHTYTTQNVCRLKLAESCKTIQTDATLLALKMKEGSLFFGLCDMTRYLRPGNL